MTELPDESLDKTRVVVFPFKHDKFWVNKFCAVVISILTLSRGKVLLFQTTLQPGKNLLRNVQLLSKTALTAENGYLLQACSIVEHHGLNMSLQFKVHFHLYALEALGF